MTAWKRSTLPIARPDGRPDVVAAWERGTWAVYRAGRGDEWRLVHTPTGRWMATLSRIGAAKQLAADLDALGDWQTVTAVELGGGGRGEPAELVDKARALIRRARAAA